LWNLVILCFSGIDFTFLVVACPRWGLVVVAGG